MSLIDVLFPLAVALGLLAVGLAVWSVVSGRGKLLAIAAACLLLGAAAFAADRFIVTTAERVEALTVEVANAVVAGDVEAALGYFSPTASAERATVRFGLGLITIDPDLRLSDWETTLSGGETRAVVHVRANGTVRNPRMGFERHVATRWRLTWRVEAGEWKIVQARRLDPITGQPQGLREGL